MSYYNWFGSSSNYLAYPAGDFAGSGGWSQVVLCRPVSANNRLMGWFNGATEQGFMLLDTGALFSRDDFTSGVAAVPTTGLWYVLAITKAPGSSHYRCHSWPYDPSGSGAMSHGEATGAGNHADTGVAATTCRVGFGAGGGLNGAIAVAGFWDRALSDAELDTLKSASLADWAALAPDLGVSYESWDTTAGSDTVWAGSSAEATIVGAPASEANPTGFDFTTSVPPAAGSGLGTFMFTGSGTGHREQSGSGSGSFTLTGVGAGHAVHRGAGVGAFAFTGVGQGALSFVPTDPPESRILRLGRTDRTLVVPARERTSKVGRRDRTINVRSGQ